ncbi:MAG: CusA/CzcA family heavy metal efflux RND transporter [Cytophagales bacterium]|nr:CusA/CzcA family heavy metal efflux RND transporter [Cytophagales bacterium]MDW8383276.1 CusA/CzcA family heavy metal efflux RND transporter [Flammeovirgaceae bacterium]
MIDKIIDYSIKNKLVIALFTAAIVIWGSYSLVKLPIDALPDVTSNQVDIITVCPNLATVETETFITAPIEMAMTNIRGIQEIRSTSRFGLSVVKLIFDDETDVYWARQQISERLELIKDEIPTEFGKPFMGPISTGLGEVFQYVIRTTDWEDKSFSLMEIRTLQDWVVRKQLLSVPGVAEVSGFGGYRKEYQCQIDLERLRSLGVTMQELFYALDNSNKNTGGAYIEKAGKAFVIRGIGLATSLEDIENIVIKLNGNTPILVKDVADVKFGNSIRYGMMNMNGKGEVAGGIIMMMKGANGNEVIRNIKIKMQEIQKSLPAGLIIEPFIDREKIVNAAIKTVFTNLIEGALIVVGVILVFLGNWRASLIAASLIPLSMLFAFILMNQFGVVGNLMSLGAIDFGLLVDSAIIVVESVMMVYGTYVSRILKSNEQGFPTLKFSQAEKDRLTAAASKQVKQSVVFGGLIILIVYFPLLTLTGIEGKMFAPMAKTISFAIGGALLFSITYIPMMCSLLLNPPKNPNDHGISEHIIQSIYTKILKPALIFLLRKQYLAILIACAVLLTGYLGFRQIGGEFLPKLMEGDFVVTVTLPVGTAMSQTEELSSKLQEMLLKKYPDEIVRIVSKIGTSELPLDPAPMEMFDMVVVLTDKSTWTKAKDQHELASLFEKDFQAFPGVSFAIMQPIENRVNDLMSGAKTDVVIQLFGYNLDSLAKIGKRIANTIRNVPGVTDLQQIKLFGLPMIDIKYNHRQLAVYGISVESINKAIQMAYAGVVAGTIYEKEKRFDLTIRLSEKDRANISNLKNLLITTADGHTVPLSALADITEKIGPAEIKRVGLNRVLNIEFNVRGRDMESTVAEIRRKIEKEIVLPKGFQIKYGGSFENLTSAKQRLAIVVPVALLIIFSILYSTFRNFKDSLLIYTIVPISAVGGVFALIVRQMNFSISAGVGFIALFGIAVLNGILLVSYFNQLRDEYGVFDVQERVLVGIQNRLRPVLMTTFVAALGFLPMALSNSAGAEVQKPLASVVIGGLFTATVLTCIILPVLYCMFNAHEKIESISNEEIA